MEYGLGGIPDVSESHYVFKLLSELVFEESQMYTEFRYPRRKDADFRGLDYEFQVSENLSTESWYVPGYYIIEISPIDSFFEEVHLRLDQPAESTGSRLFGRLKIYLNE